MKFGFDVCSVILILLQGVCLVNIIIAQGIDKNEVKNLASDINAFSLNLLHHKNLTGHVDSNIGVSPYNVWIVLALISEGASGETKNELNRVLKYSDKTRRSYRQLNKEISVKTPGIDLDTSNAIFVDKEVILKPGYQNNVTKYFGTSMEQIDFRNSANAVAQINSVIAQKTNNLVQDFVRREDVQNVKLTIASIMHFQGSWKIPFNRSATRQQDFMNENNEPIGKVDMMYQIGSFPYVLLRELNAVAVELPYGSSEPSKMSMIVILPKLHVSLDDVLKNLSMRGMAHVSDALDVAAREYEGEDVQVFLPKFTIRTDLALDGVLFDLGITYIFDATLAKLTEISEKDMLHLTRFMHRGIIDVNEEGTVATAVSGGFFQYKSPPPKFQADRPFAYFILDKINNLIVFCGKYRKPEN